jgi:hypothetical protein
MKPFPIGMRISILRWMPSTKASLPPLHLFVRLALTDAARCLACCDHALVAWVVLWDLPAYPERYAARLATSTASPYLMLAETLAGVREMLPPGLVRSERMPVDPPEVVEIWFAG